MPSDYSMKIQTYLNKARMVFAIMLVMLVSACAAPELRAPVLLTEKGLCPFEGCVYREWVTRKKTPIYAAPEQNTKVIGHLSAGTHVQALTGEVHTAKPGKYRVRKTYGKYKPGDLLWLYGYHGEGVYTVWFAGKLYEEEFSSVNYIGEGGNRCDDKNWCWGVLEQAPESVWWVKVQAPDGRIGWTNQLENFDGKDLFS